MPQGQNPDGPWQGRASSVGQGCSRPWQAALLLCKRHSRAGRQKAMDQQLIQGALAQAALMSGSLSYCLVPCGTAGEASSSTLQNSTTPSGRPSPSQEPQKHVMSQRIPCNGPHCCPQPCRPSQQLPQGQQSLISTWPMSARCAAQGILPSLSSMSDAVAERSAQNPLSTSTLLIARLIRHTGRCTGTGKPSNLLPMPCNRPHPHKARRAWQSYITQKAIFVLQRLSNGRYE
jgi:hypothetical protein